MTREAGDFIIVGYRVFSKKAFAYSIQLQICCAVLVARVNKKFVFFQFVRTAGSQRPEAEA